MNRIFIPNYTISDPTDQTLVEKVNLLDNEKVRRLLEVLSPNRKFAKKKEPLLKFKMKNWLLQKLMKDLRPSRASIPDNLYKKDRNLIKTVKNY